MLSDRYRASQGLFSGLSGCNALSDLLLSFRIKWRTRLNALNGKTVKLKIEYQYISGLCILLSISTPVSAISIDGFDLFSLYVNGSMQYDSNLFRLPDAQNSSALIGLAHRSDRIQTTGAGLTLDKSYGLQRWTLDANLNRYEYQKNGFLNYSARNYKASWLWQLTPDLTGTIGFEQLQQPVNFADYLNYSQTNIRTNENRRFDADWRVSGGWHSLAAFYETRQDNSALFTADGAYTQRNAELGIKYVFPSNSTLSFSGRSSNGNFTDRVRDSVNILDTDFNEKEIYTRLNWQLTGKTQLNAKLGYLKRSYENFAQRDYSGMVGNADFIWLITGKLQLNGRVERNLYSYQDFNSSYYVNRLYSITPAWLVTEKTSLRLTISSAHQDYKGSLQALALPDRRDRLKTYQLSANWNPTEKITLIASTRSEHRDSPLYPLRQYSDRITGVSANVKF